MLLTLFSKEFVKFGVGYIVELGLLMPNQPVTE